LVIYFITSSHFHPIAFPYLHKFKQRQNWNQLIINTLYKTRSPGHPLACFAPVHTEHNNDGLVYPDDDDDHCLFVMEYASTAYWQLFQVMKNKNYYF